MNDLFENIWNNAFHNNEAHLIVGTVRRFGYYLSLETRPKLKVNRTAPERKPTFGNRSMPATKSPQDDVTFRIQAGTKDL